MGGLLVSKSDTVRDLYFDAGRPQSRAAIMMLRRKPFTYLGSLSPSLTQSRTSLLISGSLTVLWPAPSTAPTTWLHRLDARASQPSRLDRPKPCRDCCAEVATPAHPFIALSLIMQRRSTHIQVLHGY